MKNRLLIVAAIAEIITGLALIVVPSFVVKLLFGTDIAGVAVITSQFAGPVLIRIGCCLLASIRRALRNVDLQFACYRRSSLPCSPRHVGRASSVAGSRVARNPNAAIRSGLVQATSGESNIITTICA